MDYVFQQTYLDTRARVLQQPLPAVSLTPSLVATDLYRPAPEYVPGQYGINLYRLGVHEDRGAVSVKLRPDPDADPGDFRVTLVAVGEGCHARYSTMGRAGERVTLAPAEDESLYLAVAVIPRVHQPRVFKDTQGTAQSFPYAFGLVGAKVREAE